MIKKIAYAAAQERFSCFDVAGVTSLLLLTYYGVWWAGLLVWLACLWAGAEAGLRAALGDEL